MATGLNYCSAYESTQKVSECVWATEKDQSSSEEKVGGGITWDTQAMEVKAQLISAPDPFICPDRKQRERMAELQERRRSLQTLLTTRLAELRHVCLQEAELTGVVPSDFPLEAGEKAPCVRRRGGAACPASHTYREEEDCQRTKSKKTLFSAALRKHSEPEQNTHAHTHTYNGKRTVHRGCHTDDTVRSESSSTSDSTGHEPDDAAPHCRLPLVSAGSPVEHFYQNKARRNSVHNRNEHPEPLQTHRPHQLPPPLPPPPSLHPPPLPPRSQDSSSSSGPSDPGSAGELKASVARHSSSSEGLLERISPPQEGQPGPRGAAPTTGGGVSSSDKMTNGRTKFNQGLPDWGGTGRGRGGARAGAYSNLLLDYVWGKQQQLQRQQTASRQPGSAHPLAYNAYAPPQPVGAPPSYRAHAGEQRRVKVTRTKSCGPFLPVQQGHGDAHSPPLSAIQPDPHPHLLPPRPPQLHPSQDSQLEEATRSIHKALALEGLRDWYLRNTIGSNQSQVNGKVTTGVSAKVNGGVKGQLGGGGALQIRRKTIGVVQQPTYQKDTTHHQAPPHRKQMLPHSATFHGQPLHGRSVDGFPPLTQESPPQDPTLDQPSPGTLV